MGIFDGYQLRVEIEWVIFKECAHMSLFNSNTLNRSLVISFKAFESFWKVYQVSEIPCKKCPSSFNAVMTYTFFFLWAFSHHERHKTPIFVPPFLQKITFLNRESKVMTIIYCKRTIWCCYCFSHEKGLVLFQVTLKS